MTVEKGIRGGLAQCSVRHAVANNPYLKDFDPNQETSYIVYKDANNLYGAAMSEPLPYGEFEEVEDHSSIGPIEGLDDEGEYGYIFVADIAYPKHLHNAHASLPFLPESKLPPGGKHKKLLATLDDKDEYVVHYRALKQALKFGLKIKKIHKIIKFRQSRWMKKYVDLNTELRKKAENEFEVAFFKLMNNAVYGKCMEQIRNRLNMKLVSNEKSMTRSINNPTFIDRTVYSENLAAVHFAKEHIVMNKPIYVGQAILDISKVIMYEFFYSVLKPKYAQNIELLYMDTDSFIVFIKCKDFYKDLLEMLDHYDTSNYEKTHFCYSPYNN
jgi:ribosomal protein L31E